MYSSDSLQVYEETITGIISVNFDGESVDYKLSVNFTQDYIILWNIKGEQSEPKLIVALTKVLGVRENGSTEGENYHPIGQFYLQDDADTPTSMTAIHKQAEDDW